MKRFARLYFITMGLLTVALVSVGFLLTRQGGFSAREEPSRVEAFLARMMRRLAIPAQAKNLKNPFTATPEILKEARAHFADHCASCHANDGSGQTTLGRNLYPRSPDMRQPATQSLSDGELFYIIHNGIRMSGMPAWGVPDPDKDEDSWKLALFIRHLPAVTKEEIAEMERLNPKSLHELQEQKEEEEFLRGGDPTPPPPDSHKH